MLDADFALFNVDHLVTLAPHASPAARGELGVIERAALAAKDGKIVWVGRMDDLRDAVRLQPDATVLNTHGRTVLPGFVDPHTHPVFGGNRVDDFYARAAGERYKEQLKLGGIMTTIRATRASSEESLLDAAYARAETFLRYGTTTIEAKTGYGQTQEDELKCLRALTRLQHLSALKVVPTFLPAHVLPEDFWGDADAYVSEIVDQWLPAAEGRVRFVDVWCDEGVFSVAQCRLILERARSLGLGLRAHVDELSNCGGARLAAELGAISVDHAVYLADDDVRALSESDTTVVLLPGTTFFLGSERYAPARKLIDAGVRVALGTDFNPGTSFTQNMQFVLTLAVLRLGMTAEEAIRAATLNAAAAVDMEDRVGSLEPGKYCDLSVFCVGDYRVIPYHYAMNLVESVVASGRVVVRDGQIMPTTAPVRA
jgi:imidazolonepropionase